MRSLIITLALLIAGSSNAFAQQEPPNGMSELQAYAIFLDAWRGDDYDMAVNFGAWMIEAKPETIEGHNSFNLLRQFDRMIRVYKGLADNESDPSAKTAYLNKSLNVFDEAFDTFSEDEMDLFEWKMKLGRFYHENNSGLNIGTAKIAEKYEKAYLEDPKRFTDASDGYFADFLLGHFASQRDRDKAFAMIDEIEGYATPNLRGKISEVRESLFDGPEERIDFYESQLADASGDEREQLLMDLVDLYENTNQAEKAAETAMDLYEMNASYVNTRKVAFIYLNDGHYKEAVRFLEESLEKAENAEDRKEITLELADTHQQLKQFREARRYARKAIDIDSNFGEAYMRVASIYAASISQCTGGQALERDDRTVYWLVVDYLNKAKEADPSLASNVNNRTNSYKSAMPTSEDKFFRGWETGDSFQINENVGECYAWIDETTTVK